MGRRAALAAVLAAALGLGMTGGHERARLSVGMNFKRVSATEGWGRVWAVGGTFYGFRAKGVDFTITDVKSARASGGTPACTVTNGLLDCRGTFPDGSSIFVDFGISGSGNSFQEENFFSATPNSTPQFFGTQTLGPAPLAITAKLTGTSGSATKTVTYGGQNAFNDVEVMPFNFKIGAVTKSSPAATCKTEGPGIDCSVSLAKGQTGSITFDTAPAAARATASRRDGNAEADVLLHGDEGTGYIVVHEVTEQARYDLRFRGKFPPVRARLGKHFSFNGIANELFLVENASDADRSSDPAQFRITYVGSPIKYLLGTDLVCKYGLHTQVPILAPGGDFRSCSLFEKDPTVPAQHRGAIRIIATLSCNPDAEIDCTNNKVTIDVVVR